VDEMATGYSPGALGGEARALATWRNGRGVPLETLRNGRFAIDGPWQRAVKLVSESGRDQKC